MGFKSATLPIDKFGGREVYRITSIIISQEMKPLQDVYVIYRESDDQGDDLRMAVLEQKEKGTFSVYHTSNLNDLPLHSNIQPFFFDVNGDMM